MASTSNHVRATARAILLVTGMLLALALRQGAAASPPPPANAPCGSMMIEELGLVSDIQRPEACTSLMIEQLGLVSTNAGPAMTPSLVGSGPERETVANSDTQEQVTALDGPSLVGSGPEREIVANSDTRERAGVPDGPSLVGSGPEREIAANSDRQEQTVALDESAGTASVAARTGQPF
jgi:hypothetical protein